METETEYVKYQPRALIWTERPESIEKLAGVAGALAWFGANISWAWGDFLNGATGWFGEKASQLVPPRSAKTMVTWCYVCRMIPPAQRKWDLPFAHYRETTDLDIERRGQVLQQAESEGWTVRRLREEIRGPARKRKKVVQCPKCENEFEV